MRLLIKNCTHLAKKKYLELTQISLENFNSINV